MTILLWIVGLFVLCFLLGSIPWGVVISRLFFRKDIRNEGSGNIGTTNALRTLGKRAGVAVFVLDFAKGVASAAIAVAVGVHLVSVESYEVAALASFLQASIPDGIVWAATTTLSGEDAIRTTCLGVAILGCTWGHIFSPWLGFKGGKGIAVAVGALFIVFGPLWALLELAVFAVFVATTRYVSLGSIAAALLCPFLAAYLFLIYEWNPLAFVCCTVPALTVIWAHRGNIARLCAGEERRLGNNKKQAQV